VEADAVLRRSPDARVDVFEAGPSAGGAVTSARERGLRFELGPNSMAAKHAAVYDLVHRKLGLGGRVVQRDRAAKSFFIVKGGRMLALPMSVGGFFRSKLFSAGAKLRVCAEPFVPRLRDPVAARHESVDGFFRRRFGREIAETVIDPAVAGIFSGVTARLSMKHAFARVWAAEREAGSVIGGLLRGAGKPKKGRQARRAPDSVPGQLAEPGGEAAPDVPAVPAKLLKASFSFDGGVAVLTDALEAAVRGSGRARVRLGTPVRRLTRSERTGRWGVNSRRAEYDAVISTIPAHAVAHVRTNDSAVARCFKEMARRVMYAPVSVVVLAYKRADVRHKLDGFGVLVPSSEKLNGLLGVTFSASNYPSTVERDDELYVTAYVGGSRYPAKALLPGDQVVRLAAREVQALLGTTTRKPLFSRVKLWAKGIPQYDAQEYEGAAVEMRLVEEAAPGLVLAGNYRDGVGLPDALNSGMNACERALAFIARRDSTAASDRR
jgi:protoporphyrinogen/coproporphyrinogen III oxidase